MNQEIEEGEFVFYGPPGSGKSTMLNIAGCLDKPGSGRIFLKGREVDLRNPSIPVGPGNRLNH